VNPDVLRKYILEIRKALGDRPDNPEFIETFPKRGYRFIAPVMDERVAEPPDVATSHATEGTIEPATAHSDKERSSGKHKRWELAIIPVLAVAAVAAISPGTSGSHEMGPMLPRCGILPSPCCRLRT
jgi:hypothetical protein